MSQPAVPGPSPGGGRLSPGPGDHLFAGVSAAARGGGTGHGAPAVPRTPRYMSVYPKGTRFHVCRCHHAQRLPDFRFHMACALVFTVLSPPFGMTSLYHTMLAVRLSRAGKNSEARRHICFAFRWLMAGSVSTVIVLLTVSGLVVFSSLAAPGPVTPRPPPDRHTSWEAVSFDTALDQRLVHAVDAVYPPKDGRPQHIGDLHGMHAPWPRTDPDKTATPAPPWATPAP